MNNDFLNSKRQREIQKQGIISNLFSDKKNLEVFNYKSNSLTLDKLRSNLFNKDSFKYEENLNLDLDENSTTKKETDPRKKNIFDQKSFKFQLKKEITPDISDIISKIKQNYNDLIIKENKKEFREDLFCNNLSLEIIDFDSKIYPLCFPSRRKIDDAYSIVKKFFTDKYPHYHLQVFGSYPLGLDIETSDLEIENSDLDIVIDADYSRFLERYIEIPDYENKYKIKGLKLEILEDIKNQLHINGISNLEDIEIIPSRVPIINAKITKNGIYCDIR